MCIEYVKDCICFRSQAEYDAEQELIARECAVEREVLDLLRDATVAASPLARRLAALIDGDPVDVADVMATGSGVFWWLANGSQHSASLARPAIRLAA